MTATNALEIAPISWFGTLGNVHSGCLMRSDNGLVLELEVHHAGPNLTPEAGVHHAALHPQQNGMVERVIRTLKEQCVHRQRFDSVQHAARAIGDWISSYNHRRSHQALDMKTPAEVLTLVA